MSYSSLGLLPDSGAKQWPDIVAGQGYKNFAQSMWDSGEVYVFRAHAYGIPAPYKSISEAYQLLDAYIASMPKNNRNQDIIAITLKADGPGGLTRFEIIFTDAGGIHMGAQDSVDIAKAMQKNLPPGSKIEIMDPAFAWVNDDKSVGFWLAKPRLWQFANYARTLPQASLGAGNTDYRSKGGGVWADSTAISPNKEIAPYKPTPVVPPDAPPSSDKQKDVPYVGPGGDTVLPGIDASESSPLLPIALAIGVGVAAAFWFSQQHREEGGPLPR
jgi:hypothetical protein